MCKGFFLLIPEPLFLSEHYPCWIAPLFYYSVQTSNPSLGSKYGLTLSLYSISTSVFLTVPHIFALFQNLVQFPHLFEVPLKSSDLVAIPKDVIRLLNNFSMCMTMKGL